MGAGPIPVRDLPDPDQGHPCDGRRLSLSRGRGLPLAIAAQGLRPVADRARLPGPLPPRRRLGGRRRPADPGGPGAAPPGARAVDRDRGFADRHLGSAEGRARGGRQQEGEGHQAPPPDLLVRLRPRRPGLGREPARHARPGTLARAGGRGRVGPAAGQGGRDLHPPGGPGRGRPARRRRPRLAPRTPRPGGRAAAAPPPADRRVSLRAPPPRGFAPLPVRWRIEATFGTLTNRYRRLTRNLEQSPEAAENVVAVDNLRRVLRVLTRPA